MERSRHGAVVFWLITGCVMIACMVVIGGITRLTGSGLSITEWDPILGALPPMNAAEWEEAFAKYKRIPEYTLVNPDMDLAGFKDIFFWEYLHRNWGRLMGLVFLIPFVVFLRTKRISGWLLRRCWAILLGGALVAALGWFMVASGLSDRPDVSHVRLAIHLCAAFVVFSLVLWTVFDLLEERRAFGATLTGPGLWSRLLLVLLAVQVVWGAFTAGLDAGKIYNSWPLMNGQFLPENVRAFGDLWTDLADHRDGVQFIHRNLAWLVAGATLVFALRYRREAALEYRWSWLAAMVIVQFILGVYTVLGQVPLGLGVAHQLGALVLLGLLLSVIHRTGRLLPNEG
ncbi:MAG: COX15/CtaA family protein [Flavobacteriales bacterium]|nr:COX15/CtaA family protein [Flavobacteriales bacterium]